MDNFGWMTSIDYCEHLSGADERTGKYISVFACLLVQPWVRKDNNWPDNNTESFSGELLNQAPKMSSKTCKDNFGDWLTPWANDLSCIDEASVVNKVTWKLWKRDLAEKTWSAVESTKVTVAVKPVQNQADRVRKECTRQVHAVVEDHEDAMNLKLNWKPSSDFPIFSYPIAISGLADQPAVISDEILGVSAVLSADGLVEGDWVIAAPVFTASNGTEVRPHIFLPDIFVEGNPVVHIEYDQEIKKKLGADEGYKLKCHTRAIKVGKPASTPKKVMPVTVSYDMPELAVYADVARRFFPASIWISALELYEQERLKPDSSSQYPELQYPKFLKAFVRLVGCGEEELFWEAGKITDSESILLYLTCKEKLEPWFDKTPDTADVSVSERLRLKFQGMLSDDKDDKAEKFVKKLLTEFVGELKKANLLENVNLLENPEQRKNVNLLELENDVLNLVRHNFSNALDLKLIQGARRLIETLTLNNSIARAVWGCWLVCICNNMAKFSENMPNDKDKDKFAEFLNNLRKGAKFAVDNPDEIDPEKTKYTLKPGECLEMLEGLLDYIPGFWEKLNRNADITEALNDGGDIQKSFTLFLSDNTWLPTHAARAIKDQIQKHFNEQNKLIKERFRKANKRADDQSLTLHFGLRALDPTNMVMDDLQEQKIRGHILALRAGFPGTLGVEWLQSEWIDARAVKLVECKRLTDTVLQDDGLNSIIAITARGASMSNGLQVMSVIWPDASFETEAKSKDTRELYISELPPLPAGQQRLMLGYGLYYQALAGTLDNAGSIMEKELRSKEPTAPIGVPRDPSTVFERLLEKKLPFRYLSRVVPGLAIFSQFDDLGLSKETLVHQHLAKIVREQEQPGKPERALDQNSNVVILFNGKNYKTSRPTLTVKLKPPMCTVPFAERWLNADLMAPKNSAFRWDPVRNFEPARITSLIENLKAEFKVQAGKKNGSIVIDPSIKKLRVSVTWYNENGAKDSNLNPNPIPKPWSGYLELNHLTSDGNNWNFGVFFPVIFDLALDAKKPEPKIIEGVWGISIPVPPGSMAKIDVRSMVLKKYVDEDSIRPKIARFDREVFVEHYKADEDVEYYISNDARTLWVESLPDSVPEDLPKDFKSALKLRYPGDLESSQAENKCVVKARDPMYLKSLRELSVSLECNCHIPARWINGLRVEPKRWQWSGYPVRFPKSPGYVITDDLNKWVPLYAGTRNDQPRHPSAAFSSQHDATNGWTLKEVVMQPVQLPAQRVPMHLGIEVTPVPRFESLLVESVIKKYAATRIHLYATVPGITQWKEDTRLTPPVWREAIPLPQTMESILDGKNEWKLKPTEKGVLLLLDGAMYDTDDTASLGGVAERMELDIVGTWVSKTGGTGKIEEMGVNPIFHKPTSPGNLKLILGSPFGLGYDLGKGGNPAQTGLIVRPDEGKGEWLLAKCRLRRMILPEFVLDSLLLPCNTDALTYKLPLRRSNEEWVPLDFAVESSMALDSIKLRIDIVPPREIEIKLPNKVSGGSCRYLVSWHKGQWASAKPTWRVQVNHYQPDETLSEWKLIDRATPFEQSYYVEVECKKDGSNLPPPTEKCKEEGSNLPPLTIQSNVQVTIAGGGKKVEVRKMLVSDFTDAKWISFIGNFGKVKFDYADSYSIRIRRQEGKFKLEKKTDGIELPDLQPTGELCPSLLLIFSPVVDVMRGQLEDEGGALLGVYAISCPEAAKDHIFDTGLLKPKELFEAGKNSLSNYRAVVIQAQRRNTEECPPLIFPTEWPDLVSKMFTLEKENKEAEYRLLPNYFGSLKFIE